MGRLSVRIFCLLFLVGCALTGRGEAASPIAAVEEVAEIADVDDGMAEEGALSAQPGPSLYWDLRLQMTLGESDRPKHARMFLPVSEPRQTILRRVVFHEPLAYQETTVRENLLGQWSTNGPRLERDVVIYDLTVRIDGEGQRLSLTEQENALRPYYLRATEAIQSDAPGLRRYAADLVAQRGETVDQIRTVYDFVHTAIANNMGGDRRDALTVFQERHGDAAGKARLLVALLRARKIPARMVGGLMLRDLKRRKQYTYWVEAELNGEWMELDPTRGHFGRVPNRYLALFRGDAPLIRHSPRIEFEYEFLVMQTSREAAVGPVTELQMEPSGGGNEKSIPNPVASIVWITDRVLPASLMEKFSAVASDEQVKLSFLTVPYESRFFRGEQIEDLIKVNDRRIRRADALVLHTRDDAGLYALMSQGARRSVFENKLLYVNGDMVTGVSRFFGHALFDMFHPKGLYIVPESMDANDFWDVVYDNFLNGMPIHEVSEKWHLPLQRFEQHSVGELSWWRQFLLRTWVQAAKEGVTPQAINLILILPLIALLIVVYRGIIGFETFGTFTPAIICVAFLRTGIFWGLFLFLIILGLGVLLRAMLARVHLFLVARMALLIALVSLVMISAAIVGIWWGVGPLVNVSVFPMVIMAGVIENFTRTHMEVGWGAAVRLSASTLGICVIAYLATEWFSLPSVIFVYPELLILIMVLTMGIGMWRGLRVTEIWKYYRVGKSV